MGEEGEVIRSVALANPLLTKAGTQQPSAPKARPRPGILRVLL